MIVFQVVSAVAILAAGGWLLRREWRHARTDPDPVVFHCWTVDGRRIVVGQTDPAEQQRRRVMT